MKSRKKPSGRRRRNKPEKPPAKTRRSPPKPLKPASREKGVRPLLPVGPKGASHKRGLTPFSREMAKFPSENPLPVLRVAKDGTLLYANPVARSLVRGWGGALGRAVPKEWSRRVRRALVTGKSAEWEFEHRGRVFAAIITPISNEGYANLYARDLTERKRAEEDLHAANRTLRALSHSNRALVLARDEQDYLNEACDIIVKDCGHAMVWIGYAQDDADKTVRPVASAGFEQGYLETLKITYADIPRGRGPTGTAIRTGRPCACANMLTDPRFAPWRAQAIRRGYASSVVLPLLADGKAFGAISIYFAHPGPLSEDETALLTELADDVARGIATLRLRRAHAAAEKALREAKEDLEVRVRERTAELRTASLYARSLIEASLDPLVTISPDGKVTDVNRATEQATGLPRERLIGTDFSDYFTECDQARAGYRKVLVDGLVRDYPLTLRHVSGRTTDVLYHATVYRNEAGDVQGVFAAARDITERKRAEQALAAGEARYRALMEEAAEGILVADVRGVILEANSSLCRMTGYEEPELLGRNIAELIPKEELARKPLPMDEVRAGRTVTTERQMRRKDGSVIDLEGTVKLLLDGRVLFIARDVTPRRHAQEMLRIYQARLKSMATELSLVEERQRRAIAQDLHDGLGQALAAAKMKIGALKTQIPSKPAHAALEDVFGLISRSLEDTRSLTFELCPPVLYEIGLEPALDYLVETFQRDHGVPASFETDGRTKPLAENLRTILYRSARELLINVAKHAHATKVRVASRDVGGRVQVVVEDDGTGFDASVLLAGVHPAGGFGLFSIREQMGYLGGFFEIESTPGRGTRAVLTAPLAAATPRQEREP